MHAALKSQLFRANLKENPRPPIPYTHEDFMSLDLPTMFTQTADGKRFLDKRGWMDETRTKSMCLWLSDWGCDVLKTHPVWMLDERLLHLTWLLDTWTSLQDFCISLLLLIWIPDILN